VTAYRLNRFTMTDAEALAGATADITEWADDELESKVTYRAARITGISGSPSPHLILATTGAQITDARTGSVLGTRPAETEWHVMFTWICEVTNIRPAGAPARQPQAPHPVTSAVTVTIWHNIAVDAHGRHTAMLDGYQPGDPVVAVFTYQADPAGRTAEEIADEAYDIFNDHPRNPEGEELARRYYRHRLLRSLSIGDVVVIGEAALAAGRAAGWTPVSGGLNESRADQHGTHPLPDPGRLSDTGT